MPFGQTCQIKKFEWYHEAQVPSLQAIEPLLPFLELPPIIKKMGAAFAVLCIGLSYAYMLVLADTWRKEETDRDGTKGFYYQIWNSPVFISTVATEKLRFVPVALWVLSIVFFSFGLATAFLHL